MPTIYPITITDSRDLDLVYEGLHVVYSGLGHSAQRIQQDILRQERELRELLASFETDIDAEEPEYSETIKKEIHHQKIAIKRKRLVKRDIERKLNDLHELLKRLCDPRPTPQQVEVFQEKKKRASVSELIRSLEEREEKQGALS